MNSLPQNRANGYQFQPGAAHKSRNLIGSSSTLPTGRISGYQVVSRPEPVAYYQTMSLATPESLNFASSFTVPGSISKIAVECLIDSSAGVSAICAEKFYQIPSEQRPTLIEGEVQEIKTVSGELVTVLGTAIIELTLGKLSYCHQFVVIPHFHYELVLGLNFLISRAATVDFGNGSIKLKQVERDRNLRAQPTESDDIVILAFSQSKLETESTKPKLQLDDSIEIPPFSENIITAIVPETVDVAETGVIEPSEIWTKKYDILGAATLITVPENRQVPFRLLNPTDKTVKLYKNCSPGKFFKINPQQEIRVMEPVENKATSHLACSKSEFDFSNSSLSFDEQQELLLLLDEYRDVFAQTSEDLGRTAIVKHFIDTGDSPPIRQRPYRVSPATQKEIDQQVQEMLEKDIIQPSVSPWSSPVVLVKKRDWKYRFCVDYRKLNAVTQKDSYPLPRIDDTLDRLQGTCYFSTLDLQSGYWQFELDPSAREKTAFTTNGGFTNFS